MDPGLRAAVEAVLADRARAYLVATDKVTDLAAERGRLLVEERLSGEVPITDAATRRCLDAVAEAGGGRLIEAVRRDATGGVRRLLARAVWMPDLAACLAIQASLPAGWVAVARDGSAVVDDTGVTLGAADSVLERRAEHARLNADLERAEVELAELQRAVTTSVAAATQARSSLDAARAHEASLTADRRRAEEAERAVARESEAIAREVAWHEAQRTRLDGELARLREAVEGMTATAPPATSDGGPGGPATDDARAGLAAWETRSADLRERRDRLAARLTTQDATRLEAEHRRARAEAAATMTEERIARAEREIAALAEHEARLTAERDALRGDVATATAIESSAREALTVLRAADDADRTRLSEAERAASGAREHLRSADDRLRAADHAELEARLGLDSLRESVLVELAGMGGLGLASLGVKSTPSPRMPARVARTSGLRQTMPTHRMRARTATGSPRTPRRSSAPWPRSRGAGPTSRRRSRRRRPGGSHSCAVATTSSGRPIRTPSMSTRSSRRGSRPSRRRIRTCSRRSARPASSSPSSTR